jgi:cell fate (sporulation/competence/biofilm development) regulator YlbF (YheA/YmcA/DUF963 family)
VNTLIELARRLGRQIAAHERTTQLKQAQAAVSADAEARQLVEAYQQQAQKITELEEQQKPIEVEDKHKLREIEEKISTNAKLVELTRRQVDFIDMMRKIKQTIDEQLEIEA